MARIKNAKKKKERERREQDIAAKRHMQNARVVQKTLVYVLNLPLKVITDEVSCFCSLMCRPEHI